MYYPDYKEPSRRLRQSSRRRRRHANDVERIVRICEANRCMCVCVWVFGSKSNFYDFQSTCFYVSGDWLASSAVHRLHCTMCTPAPTKLNSMTKLRFEFISKKISHSSASTCILHKSHLSSGHRLCRCDFDDEWTRNVDQLCILWTPFLYRK